MDPQTKVDPQPKTDNSKVLRKFSRSGFPTFENAPVAVKYLLRAALTRSKGIIFASPLMGAVGGGSVKSTVLTSTEVVGGGVHAG